MVPVPKSESDAVILRAWNYIMRLVVLWSASNKVVCWLQGLRCSVNDNQCKLQISHNDLLSSSLVDRIYITVLFVFVYSCLYAILIIEWWFNSCLQIIFSLKRMQRQQTLWSKVEQKLSYVIQTEKFPICCLVKSESSFHWFWRIPWFICCIFLERTRGN